MGSITIDESLMDAVGLLEGEMVHVVNNNNGERIVTYVIKGKRDSGVICLNGAAAHKFSPGDVAIIMAYATMTPEEAATFKPKVVIPEKGTNRLL
jgi:aspartate 1-decarboxylase